MRPAPSERARPIRCVGSAVRLAPGVALFDDEAFRIESEERCPGERLLASVMPGHDSPPVDRGTGPVDERLSEPTLGGRLIGERPGDVVRGSLTLAERM